MHIHLAETLTYCRCLLNSLIPEEAVRGGKEA